MTEATESTGRRIQEAVEQSRHVKSDKEREEIFAALCNGLFKDGMTDTPTKTHLMAAAEMMEIAPGKAAIIKSDEERKVSRQEATCGTRVSWIDGHLAKHRREDAKGKKLPYIYSDVAADIWPELRFFEDAASRDYANGIWLYWKEGKWGHLNRFEIMRRISNMVKRGDRYTDRTRVSAVKACIEVLAVEKRAGLVTDIDADKSMTLDESGQAISMETREPCEQSPLRPMMKRLGASYKEGASCPRFLGLVDEWMGGDASKIRYLQFLAWLCLYPGNPHRLFIFFTGGGKNGKSTFVGIMEMLLGEDMSVAMNCKKFLENYRGEETTAFTTLMGKRMVSINEIPSGQKWNSSLLKTLTGGDTLETRRLHHDAENITVDALFIALGNNKPDVTDASDAWKDRFRTFAWNFRPAKPIKKEELMAAMHEERDGILMWALEGGRWESEEDVIPAGVKEQTQAYLEHYGNPVKTFAEQYLEPAEGENVKVKDLFDQYKSWRMDHIGDDEEWVRRNVKRKFFLKDLDAIYSTSLTRLANQDVLMGFRSVAPSYTPPPIVPPEERLTDKELDAMGFSGEDL